MCDLKGKVALVSGAAQGIGARTAEVLNDEETRALVLSRHPIGRLGDADDVATAIRYLASDDSSFVTGAELVADGGNTAV